VQDHKERALIHQMAGDPEVRDLARRLFIKSCDYRYSYHFTWLGRPIIQYPQDLVALQEVIWSVQPDLIVETGIAHGGSTIFYASMLELLGQDGHVVGIDIEIRPHNRAALDQHPLRRRLTLIEGSSVDESIANQVREIATSRQRTMVILDSFHTHDHVLRELELYSPLVSKGSYVVVLDTVIEDMPAGYFRDRPWDRGNSPRTAVEAFLRSNDRFTVDTEIDEKLLISVAPGGYLRCVKD